MGRPKNVEKSSVIYAQTTDPYCVTSEVCGGKSIYNSKTNSKTNVAIPNGMYLEFDREIIPEDLCYLHLELPIDLNTDFLKPYEYTDDSIEYLSTIYCYPPKGKKVVSYICKSSDLEKVKALLNDLCRDSLRNEIYLYKKATYYTVHRWGDLNQGQSRMLMFGLREVNVPYVCSFFKLTDKFDPDSNVPVTEFDIPLQNVWGFENVEKIILPEGIEQDPSVYTKENALHPVGYPLCRIVVKDVTKPVKFVKTLIN